MRCPPMLRIAAVIRRAPSGGSISPPTLEPGMAMRLVKRDMAKCSRVSGALFPGVGAQLHLLSTPLEACVGNNMEVMARPAEEEHTLPVAAPIFWWCAQS